MDKKIEESLCYLMRERDKISERLDKKKKKESNGNGEVADVANTVWENGIEIALEKLHSEEVNDIIMAIAIAKSTEGKCPRCGGELDPFLLEEFKIPLCKNCKGKLKGGAKKFCIETYRSFPVRS